MDSRLLLDDTTLRMGCIGLGVLADDVHAFDDNAILGRNDGQDLTGLALVIAGVAYTVSPFLICNFFMILKILKDLRCQ